MSQKKRTHKKRPISGVITALVTPFYKGRIDFISLKRLLQQQLSAGVDGFVINGTTGESPTLTKKEVEAIFRFVKKNVPPEIPLIIGTGSNSTATTIEQTQLVKKLKADAALVVVPYYNKPAQNGLAQHFALVAQKTRVPILLYNVPGRTVVSMSPETTLNLQSVKNIVGIKEASGDLNYIKKLKAEGRRSDFILLSGDDASVIDFMLEGGHGVISVISHVLPAELKAILMKAQAGVLQARSEYSAYSNINKLLGIEANPIPVKWMLYKMGILRSPELRLPLTTLSIVHQKNVELEMQKLGLIK